MPVVIVVSGPPGAGKSTVAQRLRVSLGWPLLAKDDLKESLFEALGWSDRAWSKRLSAASYALMFRVAKEMLVAGNSCILEGNFRWSENEGRFAQLAAACEPQLIQIFCRAPDRVLLARLRARIAGEARHPGHVDRDSLAELEAELRERPLQPLPLGVPPVVFDSSSEDRLQLEDLVAQVVRRCRTIA